MAEAPEPSRTEDDAWISPTVKTSITIIVTLTAAIGVVCLTAGCRNPFDERRFETVSVPPERFEQVEALDLDSMSKTPPADDPRDITAESPPAELPLALDQCRAAALQNNLRLKVQLFDPAIAQERTNEQIAAFEPLAFSQFDFTKTDAPTAVTLNASQEESIGGNVGLEIPLRTGGTVTIGQSFERTETNNTFSTLNPAYTTDLELTLSQPLLRGGGIRTNTHEIRIARYDSQIAQARAKLEVTRVLAAVDIVYWRLYAARRELEVRKQEYDLAVSQRDRAERMVDAGKIAEIEILRADAGVAERLEAIIIAENRVRDRQRELKRILNRPDLKIESPTITIPTTEPNPRHYLLDTESLLACALTQRMELLETQLQIAKDISTVDFERNGALPLLALDYSYNINGLGSSGSNSYDLMLQSRFVDHQVGLSLQVPLGNQQARSRLRAAILRRRQDILTQQHRELTIKQDVLNAADQLEANWQRLLAGRRSTVLAGRTLEAEQRQFEQGLRTSTDVLDAQARFADAQLAEIRALAEYQIAQVDLAFATGTLIQAARVNWQSSAEIDAP